MTPTPLDLDAIRERWDRVRREQQERDSAGSVRAATALKDIDALISEVERLREATAPMRDALLAAASSLAWVIGGYLGRGETVPRHLKEPDAAVRKALASKEHSA